MIASGKKLPPSKITVSNIDLALANKAAKLRNTDMGVILPFKTYIERAIESAGLPIGSKQFRNVCRILGRRGAKKVAELKRKGLLPVSTRSMAKKLEKPKRFSELLFHDNRYD